MESLFLKTQTQPEITKLKVLTMDDWRTHVLLEEKPVLVDFRAPWCAPFLLRHDSLAQLAEEAGNRVKLFQLDISQFVAVAMTYRLIDFPTLSLFKGGQLLKSCVGSGRISEMKLMIGECLARTKKQDRNN